MAKAKADKSKAKSETQTLDVGCCKIDALVSVDSRGQLVLPKDLRKKANIKAGDKLAVISWEKGEELYCMLLMKADDFADTLRNMLGPMMKGILG
jgi:AbrB family looped-hinge helix DNA binding protein